MGTTCPAMLIIDAEINRIKWPIATKRKTIPATLKAIILLIKPSSCLFITLIIEL